MIRTIDRLLISGSGVRVSNGPPKNPGRRKAFLETNAAITVPTVPTGRIVRIVSA
jgi:hypothetical protein